MKSGRQLLHIYVMLIVLSVSILYCCYSSELIDKEDFTGEQSTHAKELSKFSQRGSLYGFPRVEGNVP